MLEFLSALDFSGSDPFMDCFTICIFCNVTFLYCFHPCMMKLNLIWTGLISDIDFKKARIIFKYSFFSQELDNEGHFKLHFKFQRKQKGR